MQSFKIFCRSLSFGTLALSAVIVAAGATQSTFAQARPGQVETVKGKISEVIRKGRSTTLVVVSDAGGDPINVIVSPRMQFAVEAKGDLGFLREKQVVSGKGTLTNQSLFAKQWTVHVGVAAKKIRPAVQKSAKAIGQSQNSYDFAGPIVSRQQDKDYPDYETLTLKIPQLKGAPVYIDKGATVTVSMTETDRVEEGMNVEFVPRVTGSRVQVLALRVLLDKPLKSEEFFAEEEKKSSSSRRRTSSSN